MLDDGDPVRSDRTAWLDISEELLRLLRSANTSIYTATFAQEGDNTKARESLLRIYHRISSDLSPAICCYMLKIEEKG